jgi:pyruvate dehydrogenase E2 component (dihydrolipoamide acetyltransferase)
MSYVFLFPDLGEGLTEGKLLQWYVQEGAQVKEGDLIAKVETDKVVADIPIPRTGRVARLHGKVDEILLVGRPLVELDTNGQASPMDRVQVPAPVVEAAPAAADAGPGVVGNIEVATGSDVMPASGEGLESSSPTSPAASGRVLATPVARRMAHDLGVELSRVAGSGPQGRVMKADIHQAAAKAGALAPAKATSAPPRATEERSSRTEPLSQLRRTVAARMVKSKFSAPHATTFEEVEVSELVALRQAQRDRYADQGLRLSYMPFICRAVALALVRHPKLNCRLDMEAGTVTWQDAVHLGLAVDTPEGLMVPVIRNADQLSIRQLAEHIADLAERARTRQIRLDELRGGTFTITNYGAIAGIYGAPIINTPESAILGVGRLLETPVVKHGAVVPGRVLPLSLAVDHRIIDGGDAARFLKELMGLLADPVGMLLE